MYTYTAIKLWTLADKFSWNLARH